MTARRWLKDRLAGAVARLLPRRIAADPRYFGLFEARGLHVTPVHYYQPIPDTRALPPDLWRRRTALAGIDLREDRQLALLGEMARDFRAEYEAFPRTGECRPGRFVVDNGGFRSVDAEVLYGMIRRFRPRRILEIGSGYSTYLAAIALEKNRHDGDGRPGRLAAIEPHPNDYLKAGFPGLDELLPVAVQEVPLARFEALQENDILFIDSSHVLRIGSDVQFEFLEVLPRLRPGVLVHVHDIFLPAEYPRPWVMEQRRFWNEQYLLQAFLAFNTAFEVVLACSHLHLAHPEALERAFPSYAREREWPGSFWMRRVR